MKYCGYENQCKQWIQEFDEYGDKSYCRAYYMDHPYEKVEYGKPKECVLGYKRVEK